MTRTQDLTRHLAFALTALAASLLAGCGGGSSIDVTESATTASAQGILSGSVVKGPVSGATVKAFALSGGMMGAQISSAVTDPSGAFTMTMGNYTGPVMLQTSGGTYINEATGMPMAMGAGDMMTAVLPGVAPGANVTGVAVTPLTAMAQAMAQRMTGGLTGANIAAANAAVGNYFMVHDIVQTQPMNPLVPGSATGATQDMMNYGMTLAAMSQYAKGVGMSSSSGFVTAMMNDASDGIIDGKASGTQIAMGGGMPGAGATPGGGGMMGGTVMGPNMMEPAAGRAGLSTAMIDFMNSSHNRSGVPAGSMATLMLQLRDGTGQLR